MTATVKAAPRFLTSHEVAARIGVTPYTLWRHCKLSPECAPPFIKVNRTYLFDPAGFERWLLDRDAGRKALGEPDRKWLVTDQPYAGVGLAVLKRRAA
jgi:hypothetical protein